MTPSWKTKDDFLIEMVPISHTNGASSLKLEKTITLHDTRTKNCEEHILMVISSFSQT